MSLTSCECKSIAAGKKGAVDNDGSFIASRGADHVTFQSTEILWEEV